ncbi:MAG: alpha-L-fucosidase, partial [Oscillospiraceae bacterium]
VAGEMSQTICASWSYGACDLAYKSIPELITTMCFCRGAGCNYLLNITPTSTGKILDIQKAMIETLGKWININKKPFYEGMPTDIKGPGNDFALKTPDGKIYIFAFDLYNSHPRVYTGLTENISKIIWLDNEKEETFFQSEDNTLCMNLSPANSGYHMIVRVAELTVNK